MVAAGGLHIIGTERHESRRIDNQLRGRAAPPGRPGLLALLPLARRRPDEAVRLRARRGPHGAAGPRGRRRDRVQARVQDDRERPDPRRGLQLRHPQARRRVRRRHQQAARDHLRRARQGPAQRGPDRDGPRVPRRRGRGDGDQYLGGGSPAEWNLEGLSAALRAMGLDGPRPREEALDEAGDSATSSCEYIRDLVGRPRSRRASAGARRRGLVAGRAVRAAAHDRQPVGRAPHRARRHAPGHRPPRLRPAGPAQRVPQGGVPPLRGAVATSSGARSRRRSSGSPSSASRRPCRCPAPASPHGRRQEHTQPTGRSTGVRRTTRRPATARSAARRRRGGRHGRAPPAAGSAALAAGAGAAAGDPGLPADPMRTARETPGDAAAATGARRRASPRPARGSGATTRAGAARARSTRSVTGPDPRPDARDLVRLFLIGGLAVAVAAGVATFRIWQQGDRDEQRPADAIVVLGAAQYDGRPVARVRGPARARRRAVARGPRQGVRRHRRQAAGRSDDRGGRRPRVRDRARRPGRGDLRRGRGAQHADLAARPWPTSCEPGTWAAPFSSRTRRTCCGSCGSPTDLGLEAYGSPTRTSPVQRDPLRTRPGDAHELGALAVYFVSGGRRWSRRSRCRIRRPARRRPRARP